MCSVISSTTNTRSRKAAEKIAQGSKKWFHVRDTYGVEIAPDQEDIVILAVTVALDQMAYN
jgi:uncharacterized protein YxjI